jgi:hypothetical protein
MKYWLHNHTNDSSFLKCSALHSRENLLAAFYTLKHIKDIRRVAHKFQKIFTASMLLNELLT